MPIRFAQYSFSLNIKPVGGDKLLKYNQSAIAQHRIFVDHPEEDQTPTYLAGDMHGNALKFLVALYLVGVLEYSKPAHEKCAALYLSSEPCPNVGVGRRNTVVKNWTELEKKLSKVRSSSFDKNVNDILRTFKWNPGFKGQLVLLGYQLHDRVRSDYMTLKLFAALHERGIHYTPRPCGVQG